MNCICYEMQYMRISLSHRVVGVGITNYSSVVICIMLIKQTFI